MKSNPQRRNHEDRLACNERATCDSARIQGTIEVEANSPIFVLALRLEGLNTLRLSQDPLRQYTILFLD
jgi:hypothetical protein